MSNARSNVSLEELLRISTALVDYISKMDQKELTEDINRIQKKNISWRQWFYSGFAAILPGATKVDELSTLSSKSSLEIADNIFKETVCLQTSVNALLLRGLIEKSLGVETESKLSHDSIASLRHSVLKKIRHAISTQNETMKNNCDVIEPKKEKKLNEKKAVKAFTQNEPTAKHVLAQAALLKLSPVNKNQTPSKHQQKNFFSPKHQKGADLRVRGEIKQPSFRR